MPSLSPTMNQGTIVKWHKKEGDTINPGDVLCEIQTDKAILGLETEEEGVLAKILKGDNSKDVEVGSLIALIVEHGTDWKTVSIPKTNLEKLTKSSQTVFQSAIFSANQNSHHSNMLGPVAKNLINEYGIDAKQVPHTGPHDILLKSDILKFIEGNKLKPIEKKKSMEFHAPNQSQQISKQKVSKTMQKSQSFAKTSDYIDIPLSEAKSLNAKKICSNKNAIPHSYLTSQFSLNALHSLSEKLKNEDAAFTWLPIFVKAVAVALKKNSTLNAAWIDNSLQLLKDVNISLLLNNKDELFMVPSLKEVDTLTVLEISKLITTLKTKCKSMVDGLHSNKPSFIISTIDESSGLLGYTSLIEHPNVACLSISSPFNRLQEDDNIQKYINVTLSINSALIDDITGSNFLESLETTLESPSLLISHFPA